MGDTSADLSGLAELESFMATACANFNDRVPDIGARWARALVQRGVVDIELSSPARDV